MAEVRNFKLPAIWAKNAYTTIPTPPVVNLAYRNANLSAEDIEQGQLYGALGNSADWNQLLWLLSALADEGQNQGILSWSPLIDYAVGAWVMGTNGNAYTALKASGPATEIVDPATEEESEDMTWLDVTFLLMRPAPIYNTKNILTTSGTYTAPVSGWYKVTAVGGGGGGGNGRYSGTTGIGGGGGASGNTEADYVYIDKGDSCQYTIGAGGNAESNGGDTSFSVDGVVKLTANGGNGAYLIYPGKGGEKGFSGTSGDSNSTGYATGGTGGGNGGGIDRLAMYDATGFGAGGGGGHGGPTGSADYSVTGGKGYQGCIIIEYFDPDKAV